MISMGVIGWPVAHSKSPLIHRFWLEALGIDGDYGRFAVPPQRLGEAVRALPALGLRGVNVTVPHKVAVMDLLDGHDASARTAGAVNTVVSHDGRLTGHNTDGTGFLDALPSAAIRDQHCVVIGAGGAARAIVQSLTAAGASSITILNRSTARGEALAAGIAGFRGAVMPLTARLPDAVLLVNASSLGMAGQPPLTVDLGALGPQAIVCDIVYTPLETPLLAAARARRMTCIDGLSMLIGQAAAAFELFTGVVPPRERDAELRALLTA